MKNKKLKDAVAVPTRLPAAEAVVLCDQVLVGRLWYRDDSDPRMTIYRHPHDPRAKGQCIILPAV